MGDRCWLSFTVANKDVPMFRKVLDQVTGYSEGNEEEEHFGGCLQIYFEEVNYGWYEEVRKMSDTPGCPPFIAENGSGGSYGRAVTVFFGGELCDTAVSFDGDIYIELDLDGEFDPELLEYVRKVLKMKQDFYAYARG